MPSAEVARLLEEVADRETAVSDKALAQLQTMGKAGFSVPDGQTVIRASAYSYPPGRTSEALISFAARAPRPEYISTVLEVFPQLPPKGQEWAVRLVAAVDTVDAARAFIDLMRTYAAAGKAPGSFVIIPFERTLRHSDILFPALLDCAVQPELTVLIYSLYLSYCRAGLIPPAVLEASSKQAVAAYRAAREQHQECHSDLSLTASILLDLFGYLPLASVQTDLAQALRDHDPALRFFALTGLLRHGVVADAQYFTAVAADPEHRAQLYDALLVQGRVDLFPGEFRNQAAFAESAMVNWLAYPTELGRAPDEIELMQVISADTQQHGIMDWYLFRFRCTEGWSAEHGWLAGVAGPFARNESPSTTAYGDTFSTFTPWDSQPPEAHVAEVVKLMHRWREAHSQ